MSKPDDIPQDIWEAALELCGVLIEGVARAILAERERCAKVAEGLFPASPTGRKVATKTQQIVHAAGNRIALAIRKGGPA